jgi:hypothetical protein
MPSVYDTMELCIFEATGGSGVHLTRVSSYVPKHLGTYFDQIVIRHLNFERTEEHMSKLNDFLDRTEKCAYSFKPKNLMKQRKSEVQLEERKFFCSELVAEAFMYCGIFKETDEAASNFFPSNFST